MEELKKIEEKKSFWKKKVIGIPVFMLVLMSVVLVVAAIVYVSYNTSFAKTIRGYQSGDTYVSIIGSGDIDNEVIECALISGSCTVTSGEITLTNNDDREGITHSCTITTSENNEVGIVYSGGVENGVAKNIEYENPLVFTISYTTTSQEPIPMTTTIAC